MQRRYVDQQEELANLAEENKYLRDRLEVWTLAMGEGGRILCCRAICQLVAVISKSPRHTFPAICMLTIGKELRHLFHRPCRLFLSWLLPLPQRPLRPPALAGCQCLLACPARDLCMSG